MQALPALQLQQLAVLQPLLSLPQELLGATPSSSNDETQAAAVFAWLLVQREQLAVCPDAVTAQAVFRAVWCGSSGLAAAACSKFLSWCGMWECQAGGWQCNLERCYTRQNCGPPKKQPCILHMICCRHALDP